VGGQRQIHASNDRDNLISSVHAWHVKEWSKNVKQKCCDQPAVGDKCGRAVAPVRR